MTTALTRRMIATEYYDLTGRAQKCYERFLTGGFRTEEAKRLGYHEKLDSALLIAKSHDTLDSYLTGRRVRSFEEGSWGIDSGFDLEPREVLVVDELRAQLKAYETKYD